MLVRGINLAVLMAALLFVGCETATSFLRINHFEYGGHDYIDFVAWGKGEGGIVHDPDCRCYSNLKAEAEAESE